MELGSTHEDKGSLEYFRATNHFYDIHNKRPWNNQAATVFASIKNACFGDAGNRKYFRMSKDWAMFPEFQQLEWDTENHTHCSYDGDYSWPTILKRVEQGVPLEKIAYAQGHLLHLIQDISVPAHSRNDTHILPDSLELMGKVRCKTNFILGLIPPIDDLYSQGLRPLEASNIGKIFDELATFSYGSFFSDDTILSTEYDKPVIRNLPRRIEWIAGTPHTFLYATDTSSDKYGLSVEYRILEVDTIAEQFLGSDSAWIYSISASCTLDYWERLYRRAIAYGAGALKILSDEATSRGKCFPSCPTTTPNPCTGNINGFYCGSKLAGYTGNPSDLVYCEADKVKSTTACMYGCQANMPGINDECKAGPCTTYYVDQDGDGYGDKSQAGKCTTGPSAQYTVTNNDDCNDTERNIHPGHTEWWDVLDNDCDGKIDEDGLVSYTRWHKEWSATDLEHRFANSSPGAGFTSESPRSVQLYPIDVCAGGYKAPTCSLVGGGVYAEVRAGVQLVALGECTGQFTSSPFAHLTMYLLEDAKEYRDYVTGIVPGFTCRRFGYVLSSGSAPLVSTRKEFNRLRSVFTAGGRYDNMWSTDRSEAGHADYATMYSDDIRHWAAPGGM